MLFAKIDRTGNRYGRLVVLSQAHSDDKKHLKWLCKCDCGNEKIISGDCLVSGNTRSCGCLSQEVRKSTKTTHGETYYDAQGKRIVSKELLTWYRIIGRCHNPKDNNYCKYGAKGISVCERWRNSFPAFLEDMGRCPDPKFSIDRERVKGNYEPGNCRWADDFTQMNNTTRNVYLTLNEETKTVKQWADTLNQPYKYFHLKYSKGKLDLHKVAKEVGYIA